MNDPKITKKSVPLIDDCYANPNTSTVVFQFDAHTFPTTSSRLRNAKLHHAQIEGKDLYILDHFFSDSEGDEMRRFSESASFSRQSYGSREAIERGEKGAYSMNGKERWQFFAKPPNPMSEVYKLFATLGQALNAEISTLPWELCDGSSGSPAVIANKLEEASRESQELGKHQDCNPEKKISFGIPILYSKECHPNRFVNGEKGRPFLISAMVYVTAPHFVPERGLGTVFYNAQGETVLRVNCLNMRLVLFQGDILHSIEESREKSGWRVSYVYKLIVNPKEEGASLKEALQRWMSTHLKSLVFS